MMGTSGALHDAAAGAEVEGAVAPPAVPEEPLIWSLTFFKGF